MDFDAHGPRVPYFAMEAVIGGLHGIYAEQAAALRSRLKYLQRIGLPADRPKRGTKTGYAVEDMLQLVLAFELLACGLAPLRAARAVLTNWRFNRSAFARAARGERVFLSMHPRALLELVDEVRDIHDPIADPFGKIDGRDIAEWAEGRFAARNAAAERFILLIDLVRLLSALVPLLALQGVDVKRFEAALKHLT